jgi:hypothetical protein
MTRANLEYSRNMIALAGHVAGVSTRLTSNSPGDGKTHYRAEVTKDGRIVRDEFAGLGAREAETFARGVHWCLNVLEIDPTFNKTFWDREVAFWDTLTTDQEN